jgi:hypothetical protein
VSAPGQSSSRADLIGGVAWIAFGAAIVAASLAMDRLEQFGATLYTAPGLVPGLLGIAIVVLGALLAIRALRSGALAELKAAWRPTAAGSAAAVRAGLATALALVYTLGLLGRMPFWLATALFVLVFIVVFGVSGKREAGLPRRFVIAAIAAVLTSAAVTLLFEQVFLVRLP